MQAVEANVHTILVVEDEVLIRLNIADYLRDCGYRVLEAGAAQEAIDIIAGGAAVDLVFSDVQMPGDIDGFGLAQWIRKTHPEIHVVLTSGYARAAEKAAELCEDGPLLGKPYEPQSVAQRIREMLGTAARRSPKVPRSGAA